MDKHLAVCSQPYLCTFYHLMRNDRNLLYNTFTHDSSVYLSKTYPGWWRGSLSRSYHVWFASSMVCHATGLVLITSRKMSCSILEGWLVSKNLVIPMASVLLCLSWGSWKLVRLASLLVWHVSWMTITGIIERQSESSFGPVYKIASGEDDKIFDLDDWSTYPVTWT